MQVPGIPRVPLSAHLPGSLEHAVGAKGIEQKWRDLAGHAGGKRLPTAEEVLDLAKSGDGTATEVMETTARTLADAIVNISVFLDPAMIVFGGRLGRSQVLFERILDQLGMRQYDFERTRLCLSCLGENAAMLGALKIALEAAETSLLRSI
jgi:glucokinase